MINLSERSLQIVQNISDEISNLTFHHHYHVLYDIPLPENPVYLEIGCYGGGSSCLMLQKSKIKVIAVDFGHPIDESVVRLNVDKLNVLNNEFHYIKANSQSQETVDRVKQIAESVDLLFIDGDHTYYGVLTDFKLWAPLVKPGGYIVFDDYNDAVHSPEVKIAVDEIFSKPHEYDIIGCVKNTYRARPAELQEGNCFIVRKKVNVKLAIVVATYKRSDGRTYDYLTRALSHIQNQTYQNFKVFLIGDKYEDESEFEYFSTSFFDKEKITSINLSYAAERDKYPSGSQALWCAGGVNARNIGVDVAISEGFKYICHIDHDDYWAPIHLEEIAKVIEYKKDPAMIYTCSTHFVGGILPRILPKDILLQEGSEPMETLPIPAGMIHSSSCINYEQLNVRYRDKFAEHGVHEPADAQLWYEISNIISENKLKSYLIRKLTCFHSEEGYIR